MPIFIEKDEYEFFLRSAKFCEKIDKYSALLGLDELEVSSYKNENDLFNYVFANKASYGTLAESFMIYKIGNMQELFCDLVSKCRSSRNYTSRIGADLGILAGELKSQQINHSPVASIAINHEGYPVLRWKENLLNGVEIWKNSGNSSGYQKLDCSRDTEYVDKTILPYNKHEVWKYSLIYIYKGDMVGNWSEELQVLAGTRIE
jgi:hypothetical protein